ncbi:glutathione transferase [Scleromatobacter humisilvae]|uniref:Glutathione transferase n=1 Tax=Scleromatobacter humisilvae TaxID=2897159 RepID=A0A9X1YLC1_9BURK|nr:glutathione transferase [Scleromatobacter humisilvae]MCK9688283.1 glutathione transferase [Scleromatobacter humisilvae]
MTDQLTLHVDAQYASPYAMSAFVALSVKQLPFELRTVDLSAAANHAPEYAGLSMTRRVPTLVHGEFALSESSAIDEYIEDVFPGAPLYPRDPRQKARARQVQAWLRSDLMPIRMERSTEVVFHGAKAPALSAAGEAAASKLFAAVEALLPAGNAHLFDDWCIADADLALMLNRLVMHGDAVPARLAEYATRQWTHPAVCRWAGFERPRL